MYGTQGRARRPIRLSKRWPTRLASWQGVATDHLRELSYQDRKALHNFKYFTWVEQQQRSVEELNELWDPDFWERTFGQAEEWDRMIESFNERTGLLEAL